MDERVDADRLQDVLDGAERLRPGDDAIAASLTQVAALRSLRLPEPPGGAHARIARRVEAMTDLRPHSRHLRGVGAWFGAGPFPRPLVQRLAAGALLLTAAGGGASTASGISPFELAARIGDFGASLASNLGPGGDRPAVPVAGESPTPGGATSPTARAVEVRPTVTPSGGAVTRTGTPSAGTPIPASSNGSPSAGSTPVPEPGSATPTAPGGQPGTPPGGLTPAASATATPRVTASPGSLPPTPTTSPGVSPTAPTPTVTEATQTPSPTVTVSPTPTTTTVANQTQTFPVLNAGSVTLRVSGGVLSIVSIDAATGWTASIDQQSPPEVDFRRDDERIRFSAELEDGVIKTSVEVR